MQYAELLCRSNFSFLCGASHPHELIAHTSQLGYSAIAITDECSFAGVVRAHVEAKKLGVHLIIGTQCAVHTDNALPWIRIALLAKSRIGYAAISELITQARRRSPKGEYLLKQRDLADALPGVICIALPQPDQDQIHYAQHIKWLNKRYMVRLWIGVSLLRQGFDKAWLAHLQTLSAITQVPLVAVGDVLMHKRSRKPLQDTLMAIANNTPVHALGHTIVRNAEQYLRPLSDIAQLYPRQLIVATHTIASQCTFSLDELRYEYPEEIVPQHHTPTSYLVQCTWAGASERFPHGTPPQVKMQIEHELELISDLHYEAYFLTVFDIVKFARSQGILCQGRGSAANSAVCYCLGITEVDPARTSVLFERFISRERNEPPDIDVDFEHQRREEVIQYIYTKYGRDRTALTAALMTYHPRSALRDVGKALCIDSKLIDTTAKNHQWWDSKNLSTKSIVNAHHSSNENNGTTPEQDETTLRHWLTLSHTLLGFPRHLSQHTGGFVISKGPLSQLVPIENAAMPKRSIIQWDKDDLDALGLLKVDVLALGMLSAIRHTLVALETKPDAPRCMQHIPAEDKATYAMLSKADSIGVFQVESRAQMSMLPRLQPNCFYDLVIEVAIVRPGPMQGGMVHPYLRRRQGLEPVDYPSDALKQALGRTLGVPIFQEQVMQIAMLAAGFSAGEADELRRAMAAWKRKGGVHKFYDRVIDGMVNRGYSQDFAERIFRQIEGFGEYGFPESHAASFALLVYVSAWLKRHHPDAFLVGLLNSQPMGFYAPAQLIDDAQRHGVEVLPADVNHSEYLTTLQMLNTSHQTSATPRYAVQLGLHLIAGLSEVGAKRIMQSRKQLEHEHSACSHPSQARPMVFECVEDVASHAQLNTTDLQALAAANAFGSLASHRHQAYWEVLGIKLTTTLLRNSRTVEASVNLSPPSEQQTVLADYASTGFSLNGHPLALIRPQLKRFRIETAKVLKTYPSKRLARACGIVTHRQRPGTAKGVVFITLEDETGQVNVIVWPSLVDKYRATMLQSQLLAVYGIWQRDGEVTHLVAKRLENFDYMLNNLQTHSRNFH